MSRLSVVLISANADDSPAAVLAALGHQSTDADFEIIFVDGRPTGADEAPEPPDARVKHVRVPGANMPRLKAIGARQSRGDLIAFLEPYGVPRRDWAAAVLDAARSHPDIVLFGGAVPFAADPDAASLGAYAYEYFDFSETRIRAGLVHEVPGNNMIFRRAALLGHCADILDSEGLNKPFCQARIVEAGLGLHVSDRIIVEMHKRHRFWKLLRTRYSYGRCFGGTRMRQASAGGRWKFRLGSPLVPFLVVQKHWPALGLVSRQIGATLVVLSVCMVWAAGEIIGYWFGAGQSCAKLR